MFRQLARRATIVNLSVITAVVLLISAAVFIGSPTIGAQDDSANQDMLQLALTGNYPPEKISNLRNNKGRFIYYQAGVNGDISEISSQIDLLPDVHAQLANHVMQSSSSQGTVSISDAGEFAYLRISLDHTKGYVIVLQEQISTGQSLLNFLSRIGPIILVSLVLVYLAGSFITKRALVPIKNAWEKQMEFSSNASHELRTPIAIIQTNLEAATDDPRQTIEENQQWFDNIRFETSHMAKLVNDLLTLARSDSGTTSLLKNIFCLSEAMDDTANALQQFAKSKGILLQVHISPDLQIKGDREQLCRLAVILLDNAIKYTPPSGQVDFIVKEHGRQITILVSDNGVGIAKEHQVKIFDRFYRVDQSSIAGTDGTGLGLALAKWIVDEHGGTISVASELGIGTTFEVVFRANS